MNKKLCGVCPILPTPFDENNNVDVASLRRVVNFLIDCGVSGIALFGNASEAFALCEDEKELIASVVKEENAGRVPLVFGAGGTSAETAIVSCLKAQCMGADILMIMPPYMIKPDKTRIKEYYAAIAKEVKIPIMIQDAPGASGVNMDVDTIVSLAKEYEMIKYVKAEAPPTFLKVKAIADASDGAITIFGGLNGLGFYEELKAGVVGTMPAGEFPDVLIKVYNLFTEGKEDEAKEVFYKYLPFIKLGNTPGGGAMAVHKEVLRMGGIFSTSKVRGPYVPLSPFMKELLDDCVKGLSLEALKWEKK